jgi:alpha-D-xyloside xylohydrolase
MVYDGLVSKFPDEVPVTLARSGWAGSQRFGASNWNGDLTATWENFQKTIVSGLNAQLSGLAWCEKRHLFLSFPYVCPEPVLAK